MAVAALSYSGQHKKKLKLIKLILKPSEVIVWKKL